MHRKFSVERRFEKDILRQKRRGKNIEKLDAVAFLLTRDARLPSSFYPHKLSGKYEGLWECHIEHDWLLLYEINDEEVMLIRTGTHSDIFE
jgi:mRNA interferase YafQ